MHIIKPSVELWSHTPNPEALIERAGRVCYQTHPKSENGEEGAAAFVHMLIKRGHESVLEHASATLSIVCDRGVTHELVRHRLCSFSQESTRYCSYDKDKFGGQITVIEPLFTSVLVRAQWEQSVREAEQGYFELLNAGEKPEIARALLPACLKAQIVMTTNFREWRHFLRLRCAPAAHPQMREIAFMIWDDLYTLSPACFDDVF